MDCIHRDKYNSVFLCTFSISMGQGTAQSYFVIGLKNLRALFANDCCKYPLVFICMEDIIFRIF